MLNQISTTVILITVGVLTFMTLIYLQMAGFLPGMPPIPLTWRGTIMLTLGTMLSGQAIGSRGDVLIWLLPASAIGR